jgi:hypothetical protein
MLENAGGLYRLVVVDDEGFETSPTLGKWPDVKLKKTAVVCEFLFARDSGSLAVPDVLSENGKIYECGVVVDVPKITPELRDWLELNGERRWVCFAEDFNDYTHIIGEPGLGCVLTSDQSTDTMASGRNVSVLYFNASTPYRPIINTMNFLEMTSDRQIIDLRENALADIVVYAGDTLSESLKFKDATGTVENLTGSTFKMDIKNNAGAVVLALTMADGLSLINTNTELLLTKTVISLTPGEYLYELQRTYPTGAVKTKMVGKFIIDINK